MEPIQDLLSRIKWDAEFSQGEFEIAYVDHAKEQLVRIPYKETYFERGDKFMFQTYNDDERLISVPLHRVRKVYKNGALIWERKTRQ